jgi:hypothetical protein
MLLLVVTEALHIMVSGVTFPFIQGRELDLIDHHQHSIPTEMDATTSCQRYILAPATATAMKINGC